MGASGERIAVVGAGIAGLACARALADAGRAVTVLERARGVGGRCATRRIEGVPFDMGVAFLHGRDPGFLAALEAVPATRLDGWPQDVHGRGRPCQPEAFGPGERRVAFAEGVTAFPKHLARGLEVRLGTRVARLGRAGAALRLEPEAGEAIEAATAVLALAPEQAERLLGALSDPPPAVATARALLDMARSEPCLALGALYPPGSPAPPWQVSYPEDSRVLQLVSHESSKRSAGGRLALVYQAHPRWSGQHLEDQGWPDVALAEAARLLGPWAEHPAAIHPHRWRHARTDRSGEMSAPLWFRLPGGARLGLCGDRFAPGGGAEAAWLSGVELARRILSEEER